jgi:hypothetical protein
MRRAPGLVLVLGIVLGACGGRPDPRGYVGADAGLTPADGGVKVDAAVRDGPSKDAPRLDAATSSFCQGAARAEINGVGVAGSAAGEMVYMDCCEAAVIVFTSAAGERIAVSWQASVGEAPGFPVTLDLAHLSPGFGVTVRLNCDPQTGTGCTSPGAIWTGTLSGTLTISGSYSAYDMTLCLEGAADPTTSNPSGIEKLRLWAEHVIAAPVPPTH